MNYPVVQTGSVIGHVIEAITRMDYLHSSYEARRYRGWAMLSIIYDDNGKRWSRGAPSVS